jgi:hypothetical protein
MPEHNDLECAQKSVYISNRNASARIIFNSCIPSRAAASRRTSTVESMLAFFLKKSVCDHP